MEWKLELEEFLFAGCMSNHTGQPGFCVGQSEEE